MSVDLVDIKPFGKGQTVGLRLWHEVIRPISRIVWTSRRPNPTIVHACTSGGLSFFKGLLIAFICIVRKIPVVVHLHSALLSCHPVAKKVALIMSRSTRVRFVTPSRSDADHSGFFRYIPNFVPDSFWRNKQPAVAHEDGQLRVAYMGWMIQEKGLFELAKAAAEVPGVMIDMYGPNVRPVDLERLSTLIDEAGMGSRMRYCGPIPPDQVAETLTRYEALVLPSYRESFGLVSAEAMLLGIPVIATQTGLFEGVDESLFIKISTDVGSISSALELAKSSRITLRTVGQKGNEYALRNFTEDVVLRQWVNLYQDLMALG